MSVTIIPIITLFILLSGLFVAAEFAAVNVRRARLSQIAETGSRSAKMLQHILEDNQLLDQYMAVCQIGISVVSLALGAYSQRLIATTLMNQLNWESGWLELLALIVASTSVAFVLTMLQIVIGELIPKSIAIEFSEQIALLTVTPIHWLQLTLRPFLWFFYRSSDLMLWIMGRKPIQRYAMTVHTPQEIELLISESHEGGLLDDDEQRMLRNAFRMRDLTARQVMVPRIRLIAVPTDSTVLELLTKATESGFSRIPLYEETIDNIIGFVHIKDLFSLYLQNQTDPTAVLREIPHVPETVPIIEVWALLNASRQYIAVVFDEYGGTAGLITFEDLLEEIFGEFQDEFDDELPLVSSDDKGRFYLRADLLITDVNEYFELNLPEDDADTIGGLVFSQLGRPAETGDEIQVGEPPVTVQVESVEGRRITELSLQLPGKIEAQIGDWEVMKHA